MPRQINIVACKLILIAGLMLAFQITYAQTDQYTTIRTRIDSLVNTGLPKSALAEVNKLDSVARVNQNAPQQIRAVMYRISLQSYLQPDALVSIINNLRTDINRATYPVKPVLQSLLAGIYWQYYKQDRYLFSQRSRLEKPDPDISHWDLQTIIAETSRLYQLSLQDTATLQKTPVGVLDGVLGGDRYTRYLRPTLYDLLLNRALDFFLTDDADLPRPKMPFSLNDVRFFGPAQIFCNIVFKTTDTLSTAYLGVKYLQQGSLYHLQKNNLAALADLDITRIVFLHHNANLANRDSLYLNSLKQIAASISGDQISSKALGYIGSYYQQKKQLKTALFYYRQVLDKYPNGMGAEMAVAGVQEITEKSLSARVEDVNIANKPILARLDYRNITSAKSLIYHLSAGQRKELLSLNKPTTANDDMASGYIASSAVTLKYLDQLKPLDEELISLPDPRDYESHSTEYMIKPLKPGCYIALLKDALTNDTALIGLANFRVSGITHIWRIRPDKKLEVTVMNRETGEPVAGAQVEFTSRTANAGLLSVRAIADANGSCVFDSGDQGSYWFKITSPGDTLITRQFYYNGYSPQERQTKPYTRTVLFTDRQLYRPGQTVYFKGILLETVNEKSSLLTNRNLAVDFKDNNDKTVSTLNVLSNEFGSFSGTFSIPVHVLNGRFTISTPFGDEQISVEEYKRPTFQVNLLPVKENYHLNDSVILRGNVTAFSGYGLSGASIAVHITRSAIERDPDNYFMNHNGQNYAEIETDTIKTDGQGLFKIKFKAISGESQNPDVIYNYQVSADVTDASGETHTQATTVAVSRHTLVIDANGLANVLAGDSINVPVLVSNLNRQPQSVQLKTEIFALKTPNTFFKTREWPQPDQWILSAEDYKKELPFYAYNHEDEEKTWAKIKKVGDFSAHTIAMQAATTLRLNSFINSAPGTYIIRLSATGLNGDTTSVTRYLHVASKTKAGKIEDWVQNLKTYVQPGSSAEFGVGFNGAHILMEQYAGTKVRSTQWLTGGGEYQKIRIPVTSHDDDQAVQFVMAWQNRLYISYQNINIERDENDLNIAFTTFRNKLQPGEKEQWKLRVLAKNNEKIAAEMVAGLYDASLDDIASPAVWQDKLARPYRYMPEYFKWSNFPIQSVTTSAFKYYMSYVQTKSYTYEHLNLFGYSYYGNYNYGYQRYLMLTNEVKRLALLDSAAKFNYIKNAKLVKRGYDITGRVVDSLTHEPLAGASITIRHTAISTNSNSKGYFKIKVPKKAAVWFSSLGFVSKLAPTTKKEDLLILLKPGPILYRTDTLEYRASSYKVRENESVNDLLKKMQGMEVGADGTITHQGQQVARVRINGKDFANGDVARSIQNLPADIVEKIQIIEDYGDQASRAGIKDIDPTKVMNITTRPIQIRKNFSETAFFYPQLQTDENGQIILNFTMPDALTRWRFRAFAHTQQLQSGYLQADVVTQKQLSISANMPRFLREGDTITVSARLSNLTASPLQGKVQLSMFNALNMQPLNILVNPASALQNFKIAGKTNQAVSFKMRVPANLDAFTYRLTADAGNYSDGEENTLPVLPNSMLVTEAMPMMTRPGSTNSFTFDKLINQHSSTLKNKSLTLEYTQNPAWEAVEALPYMMEFPYECSEQTFSRYYANSLSTQIINHFPAIKQVFEQWKNQNSKALLSNLEKNPELKSILLEETPWLRDAESETAQKQRIALLFDMNNLSNQLHLNLDKLQKKQLPNGGFPWFGGPYADRFITQHIVAGIGQLYQLKIAAGDDQSLKTMAAKAVGYLDEQLINDEEAVKKYDKNYQTRNLSSIEVHAWYARSYYTNIPLQGKLNDVFNNYLSRAATRWNLQNVYEQAMIALTLFRYQRPEICKAINASLLETAQQSNETGMYWAKNQMGYYWYQSPVETQSLMIELFTETTDNAAAVNEMKIWLLLNKQTNNWQTTKATAAACYALLLRGSDMLTDTAKNDISINGTPLNELKPGLPADAGTGYLKTTWVDDQIKPSLGKVSIKNNGKSISWGALYWQYTENLDKITSANTDIHLERKYFIEKAGNKGPLLTAVDDKHQPKIGDLLKVVVYLKAGRDYEYIQLKDMRPSGTEPVDILSGYKYQDGLSYYQVTKDAATNFFISNLDKGDYVFEYSLRVAQPGDFSTGISTVQSMYAPAYNAHSNGLRIRFGK